MCRRDLDGYEIIRTLIGVGRVRHGEAAYGDVATAVEGLVARHAQGRLVIDRGDLDVVVHRVVLLPVGVVEVIKSGLQEKGSGSCTRPIVISSAFEPEVVERGLHVGDRSCQGDSVAVIPGGRRQARGGAEAQATFGAGIGQCGPPAIVVEFDGGRDVLAEAVHVGEGEAIQGDQAVLIDAVGGPVGDGRCIIEVGRPQSNVLSDAVVGCIDLCAVGVVGCGTAVGVGVEGPAAVVEPVVSGDTDLVVVSIGVAAESHGQRAQHGVDFRLGALDDERLGALARGKGQTAARVSGGVGQLRVGDRGIRRVEYAELDPYEIGLVRLDSIVEVKVIHGDARNGRGAGPRGKRVERVGCLQFRHVIALCDFDIEGGRCGGRTLGKDVRLVRLPVTVADYIIEGVGVAVGCALGAVMLVLNIAVIQIGLCEGRALADRVAVQQKLAMVRGIGDPVLTLDVGIVVVAKGQMGAGHGRRLA